MFGFGSKIWPGLAKLAEECGEVGQVIGKLMQTGGKREHWSGDMREALIEEMADVRAATTFVILNNLTGEERTRLVDRENAKLAKFFGWHEEESR